MTTTTGTTSTTTTSAASAAAAATRSATSQLIASLGGGSGIDMTALANNLATAQFAAKVDRLNSQSDTLDKQISEASNLKSMITNLASSLGNRVRAGDLSAQPQVANGSVATASLSGSSQPTGSYSLEVTSLASAQSLASPAYSAATDTVGSGTLTLRFGAVSGSSFTEDTSHAPVSITINSGATLSDVASAINGAGAGVTAYVANTVDGAKLVLKGTEGAQNGFVLDATENAGDPGLANLAWSPGSGSSTLLTTSADAALNIDGLSITSPSNTVTDAIPGVTLKLAGTNAGAPTKVSFADPSSSITTAMQDLTDALNQMMTEVNTDTDSKTGDLSLDPGARTLKQSLAALGSTIIMPNAPAGSPTTLADLGLSTQRDGTYVLDTSRLSATLARDPVGAAAMFTTGLYGVYSTFDNMARAASVTSDPGTLAGSIDRYTTQKTKVTSDISDLANQQEALRARLASQLTAANSQITTSQSTLSFLKNQIAAWNGTSGK